MIKKEPLKKIEGKIEELSEKSLTFEQIKKADIALRKAINKKRPTRGVIIEEKKAIYFPIQKVACTTLLNTLTGNKKREKAEKKNFHEKHNDYFKIAFVRNPYDRLVSCYEDKIKKQNSESGLTIRYGNKIYKDMDFKEFVKVIKDIPDIKADQHIKSQSFFLTDNQGNLLVDFIGKFESLEEDYKKAMEKAGIKNPSKLPHYNPSKKGKRNYRDYYDEETKKLVQERYKKDFELFGYPTELPNKSKK